MTDLPIVGVDFGTCWSSVVVRRADGSTVWVKDPLSGASFSLPSAVAQDKSGGLVYGSAAFRVRQTRPYAAEFKRRLGDPEITLDKRGFEPVELVGGYLGWLRDLASDTAGEQVTAAVVTVPASYEGHLRGLMEQAAMAAGFTEVALVTEPEAAARHALAERPAGPGERVLVYDLGGGTFDVAVAEVTDGGVDVLAHDGLPDVGGIHFDRLIADHIRAHPDAERLNETLESDDDRARTKASLTLAGVAREIKEQLSFAADHEVVVDPDNWIYELSRGGFEAMVGPLLAETLTCCDRAVDQAGLGWHDLDRVILVGGSTRIPIVKDLLAARNPKTVQAVTDPELAVAEGAAAPRSVPPSQPEPIEAFLADHPAGSTVNGTITEHHFDHLAIDLDGITARLDRPPSVATLGIGQTRKFIIGDRSDKGPLTVTLAPPSAPKTATRPEPTERPTLAERLVTERIATEKTATRARTAASAPSEADQQAAPDDVAGGTATSASGGKPSVAELTPIPGLPTPLEFAKFIASDRIVVTDPTAGDGPVISYCHVEGSQISLLGRTRVTGGPAITCLGRNDDPLGVVVGLSNGNVGQFTTEGGTMQRLATTFGFTKHAIKAVAAHGRDVLVDRDDGVARVEFGGPDDQVTARRSFRAGAAAPLMRATDDLSWYVYGTQPQIRDGRDNRMRFALISSGPAVSFAVSQNGDEVAVVSEHAVEFFDPENGRRTHTIRFGQKVLTRAAFVGTSGRLAVGTTTGRVFVVNRSGTHLARAKLGVDHPITRLELSPDGRLMFIQAAGQGQARGKFGLFELKLSRC